jgi:nucleotide-binding universal stress UspA family protein
MRKIVVGTDGSKIADLALDWAYDEAQRWSADLEVVHAWSYPYGYGGARVTVEEPPELMKLDAAKVLEASCNGLLERKGSAVTLRPRLLAGSPARVLMDEAEDADLLVVGSRGHGGFLSLLLGSTAHQVTQHAHCPVVVVRDGKASS